MSNEDKDIKKIEELIKNRIKQYEDEIYKLRKEIAYLKRYIHESENKNV